MKLFDLLLGRPLASRDEANQTVGPWKALPMLGLDGLASAAYGPEALLTVLIPLGAAGIGYAVPITLIVLGILTLLFLSYRQTIAAYPEGGGSYIVVSKNLGTTLGLLAAAALLLDYVLVVAVGISAGVGALVSAAPALKPFLIPLCLGILALLTIVNLRGVRESGAVFVLPTYGFVALLLAAIVVGLARAAISGGHPHPVVPPIPLPAAGPALLSGASLFLLARAFASGCTAMTGVEAVSDAIAIFAEPRVKNAQRTLTAIVVTLAVLLLGIALLCKVYGVGAVEPTARNYQNVLSQVAAAVFGRGVLYYATIGFVLLVLALSANTGFADFPRLCRFLAVDDFLPRAFAQPGRRLVFARGIVVVTLVASLLLVGFGGIADRLIPLFAVGAFLAFTLSQAGMVAHWRREGERGPKVWVNAAGALGTGSALVVILIAKFTAGAWITLVLLPGMLAVFHSVRRHYRYLASEVECHGPIEVAELEPPMIVIPIKRWDSVAENGLRFAMSLSPDVLALHVATDEAAGEALQKEWEENVDAPLAAAGRTPPRLSVVGSDYRRILRPLFRMVRALREAHPDRAVAVVIPELVETRWWQQLLHNGRATALKAALYFNGDRQTVVINVPWYVGAKAHRPVESPE